MTIALLNKLSEESPPYSVDEPIPNDWRTVMEILERLVEDQGGKDLATIIEINKILAKVNETAGVVNALSAGDGLSVGGVQSGGSCTTAVGQIARIDLSSVNATISDPTTGLAAGARFAIVDHTASASGARTATLNFTTSNYYGAGSGSTVMSKQGSFLIFRYLSASDGWVREGF